MWIRFAIVVGILLCAILPIQAVAHAGPVLRCTITVVDGNVYADDCDYYTDNGGTNK